MKSFFNVVFLLISFSTFSQKDKLFFIKEVPIKMKSTSTFSFLIGYDTQEDRDISVEISGGPAEFWVGSVQTVSKGKNILRVKLQSDDKPTLGADYRILASLREKGGDWTTTVASTVINNVTFTKEEEVVTDDANFDLLTPTSLAARESFDFKINYKASREQLISVSIWKGKKWLGASPAEKVQPGEGTKEIKVNTPIPKVGSDYRFVLYYGNGEGFPDKNLTSKEIAGVEITEYVKILTMDELKEKAIALAVNRQSPILTLPGSIEYELIKIINLKGEIVKEEKSTRLINLSGLPQGPYYIATSKEEYYKFVKF
ncbi:hypothetical protein [uncultured Polaribacter sp.]|uniref:hypothetical protein n=1 Tax=uncultured Polaribacter sp. TaxID=174711 RepID=UPI00262ADE90|nr:hypothetical protein [uncultured Polaribacter sp.]